MRTLVAFGIGANFYSYMERLDSICNIEVFSDNNSSKWGQYLLGDDRVCISPEEISAFENPLVVIMSDKESSIQAIEKQCDSLGYKHIRVLELLEKVELQYIECNWPQKIQRKRIHKFIELLVFGTTECNFHCEYCYVWRKEEFHKGTETSFYPVIECRKALSQQKLGGVCHINICASGETMLSKDIVELVYELLDEGHYVSIITNGTVTSKINDILNFPSKLLDRMFFKLSFHYAELKRTKLLDKFWINVDNIRNSPCSYSIEITPCDSLVQDIENVKNEFKKNANGAMPHITFTRDSQKEGLDLLSEYSLEEYIQTWKTFDSDLFDLKSHLYKRKICEYCYAGNWSYRINIVNGNIQSCYQQQLKGTIFDKDYKYLPIMPVGYKCKLDYCFNNHAFLVWGDVPDIKCKNYLQMRDRVSDSQEHWIKPEYSAIMSQKLYENNYQHVGIWDDYVKLYKKGREAAFIIFNSPDYENLGDHAIALATRKILNRLFPEKEVIEISCQQYIKENLILKNAIMDEDIVIVNGGGNLGSLWLWIEDITKNIVQTFVNNKIIVFPQTIYFENSNLGEAEKKSLIEVFNKHNDLTLMLRDSSSYMMAEFMFSKSIKKIFIPDVVLSLYDDNENVQRAGSLLCMRNDKEKLNINVKEIKHILNKNNLSYNEISTVTDFPVNLNSRRECVNELLYKFKKAKIVITDRLHGMIFCAITGTPCVAFNNISGKVFETYKWIKELDYIKICLEITELESCIEEVLQPKEIVNNYETILKGKFIELETYLKENCFV